MSQRFVLALLATCEGWREGVQDLMGAPGSDGDTCTAPSSLSVGARGLTAHKSPAAAMVATAADDIALLLCCMLLLLRAQWVSHYIWRPARLLRGCSEWPGRAAMLFVPFSGVSGGRQAGGAEVHVGERNAPPRARLCAGQCSCFLLRCRRCPKAMHRCTAGPGWCSLGSGASGVTPGLDVLDMPDEDLLSL